MLANRGLRLDRASLLILDRLERVEENILGELGRTLQGIPQTPRLSIAVTSPEVPAAAPSSRPPTQGDIWINGDRVMTWPPILQLLNGKPFVETWRRFQHELDHGDTTNGLALTMISPTIMTDDPDSGHDTFAPGLEDGFSRNVRRPELEDQIPLAEMESLLQSYILDVHSRYPILDLTQLRHIVESVVRAEFDYRWPLIHRLPSNLAPLDVAMYLLVLALGEIATKSDPEGQRLPASTFVQLALPWLGFAHFGTRCSIQALQTELLLAIYHMWSLRPWRAWQVVESAATHGEKLLLK